MRRIVAAVLGCILVAAVVPVAPADSAAGTTVVNGADYPDTLLYSTHTCPGGSQQEVTQLYRKDTVLGDHSTGFAFAGPGTMAGVLAAVYSPTTLTSISFKADHVPPTSSLDVAGYYVAEYFPNDTTRYSGYRAVSAAGDGWSSNEVADIALDWYVWSGDSQTSLGVSSTFAAFAAGHGGDGLGGWAGVEYGCDGRSFHLDDLRVTSGLGVEAYDFEGALSRSFISAPAHHDSTQLTRNLRSLTLIYPQEHYLAADGSVVGDGVLESGYIAGTAQLYRQRYGETAFRLISTKPYTAEGYAFYDIKASRRATYRVRSVPQNCCEASWSQTLTVYVKRRIKATLARQKVHRGDRIVVTGVVSIKDSGVPMVLQRRTSSGWRTLASARTTSTGSYRLTTGASSVGKWTLRVRAGAAKGLLGNVSPSFVETILRNPPPPSPPATVINPVPTELDPHPDIKARSTFTASDLRTRPATQVPALAGAPVATRVPAD